MPPKRERDRRAYRQENRERRNAYNREYRAKNREQRLEYHRKYRETHKEKYTEYYRKSISTLEGVAKHLWHNAKQNAPARGLKFSITPDDILRLYHSQGGICPLTRIPMNISPDPEDWTKPSLDRIDSSAGYVPENIRLVCKWANLARFDRTDTQFKAWCCLVARTEGYRRGS